jgi:hypothetical protein
LQLFIPEPQTSTADPSVRGFRPAHDDRGASLLTLENPVSAVSHVRGEWARWAGRGRHAKTQYPPEPCCEGEWHYIGDAHKKPRQLECEPCLVNEAVKRFTDYFDDPKRDTAKKPSRLPLWTSKVLVIDPLVSLPIAVITAFSTSFQFRFRICSARENRHLLPPCSQGLCIAEALFEVVEPGCSVISIGPYRLSLNKKYRPSWLGTHTEVEKQIAKRLRQWSLFLSDRSRKVLRSCINDISCLQSI